MFVYGDEVNQLIKIPYDRLDKVLYSMA
jgi:hypothetical protein